MTARTALDFFRGRPTPEGHTHAGVLAYPDADLEAHHDFVQWLLPTRTASRFADAPTLTADEATLLAADPELHARLLAGFDRMLAFWGFFRGGDRVTADGVPPVMRHPNHNWLRMCRAIDCLTACGEPTLAHNFAALLCSFPGTESSRPHWRAATG